MALTVRDLFDLDVFKNFRLLAGEGGLDRKVGGTDMLDHEFVRGARMRREVLMYRDHIVLSTLLYTGGDPKMITEAVRNLYELDVSGLAYKNGLGYDIPEEAIKFADEHDFPILEFGGDEFYEDIIFAIYERCGRDIDVIETEMKIETILRNEMPEKDITRLRKILIPDPRKYMKAVYVRCGDLDKDRLAASIDRLGEYNRLGSKAYAFKFRNGYFVVLSQDGDNQTLYDAQFADVNALLDFGTEKRNFGHSLVHRSDSEFAKVLKESYWSSSVAFVHGVDRENFEDIGIYRILIAEINSPDMTNYMEEYMAPLFAENKGNKEDLLTTAETYVLNNGDLDETARELFCHKNTVRYRLSKLHEMLSPQDSEKEFYVSLSFAVRLYILQKLL